MQKINYQKQLEKQLIQLENESVIPTLLLHSCCAPCSSYVLEYLSNYFSITVFYYNPNISPEEEFRKRAEEQKRLIESMPLKNPVHCIVGEYEPERFYELAKGLETVPEGGERCFRCYELRLRESAKIAKQNHFDYFTTTLSISPLKKADHLNEIGHQLEQEYGINYLYSDFKKKDGYKRSIELSHEYQLYRQNYCGCIYSKKEALMREKKVLEEKEC
ncbi:MAG: epoxyqueuosine reductase QueH [Candidatus Fimimorpha sp.]